MILPKRFWVALLPVLLVASACNRGQVEDPAPLATTEAPSPTPSPTPSSFELEGIVIEASGSAQGEGADASPSPAATGRTASPTSSPDAGATASPEATEATEPAPGGEIPLFQNAAPGSIALRLNSFTGAGPCLFNADDVVVLSFTGNTTFEPADVTGNERFPNNLIRATLRVTGDILEPEEGCVLVARSITVTQASPSPTARARTGSGTRSPAPRSAATRSPTPSPTPSPTQGSPGAAGSPGA